MKTLFITGISSGIGKGLALYYANKGIRVLGMSRRELDYDHPKIKYVQADVTDEDSLAVAFSELVEYEASVDLAILNAGVLGTIETLQNSKMDDLKAVMDTNLWGVKRCVDLLLDSFPKLTQIISISSGAAINGNKGWNAYSLSKAALNMLMKIYAQEAPNTQFVAFAPGLVDTFMQDQLAEVSEADYPAVINLHQARNTHRMPDPDKFAPLFDKALAKLKHYESGSYVDIRAMD